MARIDPSSKMKKRLLEKNANSCCVCKNTGIGLNFHHIDGDNKNTIDDNLAVLCVKDHDHFHRPNEYISFCHMDLSSDEIAAYKKSWESFVLECKKDDPQIVAMLTAYGTPESIVGMKLVFQWVSEKIEFVRTYQLLDASPDKWIDYALDEIKRLGENIKLVVNNNPDCIEYCDECDNSFIRYLDSCMAIKITAPDWEQESLATVYVNPNQPSLAIAVFYKGEAIYHVAMHKCNNQLHITDHKRDSVFSYTRRPSKRTQTASFIHRILTDWNIEKVIIGTGDDNHPTIIESLKLPEFWETSNVNNYFEPDDLD